MKPTYMQPGYQPDTVVIGESTPQMGQVTASPFGTIPVGGRPMQMMSFTDSINNVFSNYVGFEGRATRSEFWWFALFAFIVGIVTGIVDGFLFGWDYSDPTWISWIFQLAIFLPQLAVGIRTIHDHGKSGWWILLPFAILYFALAEGEAVPNAYGPVPTNQLN